MWYGGTDGILFQTGYATSDQIVRVEQIDNKIPLSFVLEQNHPNPFNPSTKIKYSIHQSSNVVIRVFDVLGDEVATLVNEELSAGEYEVEFKSHSGEGRNLPAGRQGLTSGVYFYQLKTNNFIQTKKMLLLK